MPTGRHNLIQYGSYYFTTDGLSTGVPCKTDTTGLKAIKRGLTGHTILALDGTARSQVYGIAGLPFSWTAFRIRGSVLTSIYDMERTALLAGTELALNITGGALGDFYLKVVPALDITEDADEFHTNLVYDVPFRVIVQSRHLPVTAGSYALTGQAATLTYTP